jgi:L-lactate dehydrogenase complex protein LldG
MSKAEIFGNIRRGLKRGEPTDAQRASVAARLKPHHNNLIPKRAQLPHAQQVALFVEMAEEAAAEIIEINNGSEIVGEVCRWLQHQNINTLTTATDPILSELEWDQSTINVLSGVGHAGDAASLTTAFAGIAETGTLMLYSRPESPTTLNFLPDNHIVLLKKSDIVGPYEDAWGKLREAIPGNLPRTVNLITGPSRSADIEQRLQMGAHGPKRLLILLLTN